MGEQQKHDLPGDVLEAVNIQLAEITRYFSRALSFDISDYNITLEYPMIQMMWDHFQWCFVGELSMSHTFCCDTIWQVIWSAAETDIYLMDNIDLRKEDDIMIKLS